jgi:hypothetical protein
LPQEQLIPIYAMPVASHDNSPNSHSYLAPDLKAQHTMLFPLFANFHILYGGGDRKVILSHDLYSGKLAEVLSCVQRPHDVKFIPFMRQRYLAW